MKIRIMSDIHLEFSDYTIVPLEHDQDSVLVLAGDIGLVHKKNLRERYIPFLTRASVQFKHVVLIVGNHEHYGGSFLRTIPVLREAIEAANIPNVSLLEKSSVVVDDVAFVGATLWTDCGNNHPFAGFLFQGMSDSRVIRTGLNSAEPYTHKFGVVSMTSDHARAKKAFAEQLTQHKAAGLKTVVITHHGVDWRSIHPMYAGQDLNIFYASHMFDFWFDLDPDLIVHGHTHKQFDYMLDPTGGMKTRVVVNPRGYAGHEDTSGFNETLVVEV